MAASEAKVVKVGDRSIEVGRFSTYKAIHAGELLSSILREVPDLTERLSNFGQEFRSKNSIKISRAAAELRYEPEQLEKVSEAAWEASGGYVELPAAPGPLDVAAFVLPVAFEAARDKVLELIALVTVSNSELREADQDGVVAERLDREKKFLLHSDLGEMVDLLVAASEVLQEQFAGKAGKLRAALARFGMEIETETPIEGQAEEETNSNSKPSTSTDSAEPTDGVPPTPSTAPVTSSPTTSSAA